MLRIETEAMERGTAYRRWLEGKTVAVVGLAKSGVAAARLVARLGSREVLLGGIAGPVAHNHARPSRRGIHTVRNAIGQLIEKGNGNRDGDEGCVQGSSSSAFTFFISSHTSRRHEGLRRR